MLLAMCCWLCVAGSMLLVRGWSFQVGGSMLLVPCCWLNIVGISCWCDAVGSLWLVMCCCCYAVGYMLLVRCCLFYVVGYVFVAIIV